MPNTVPSREQVLEMKDALGGWQDEVALEEQRWRNLGFTDEQAGRAVEPLRLYWLGLVKIVDELEEFYRMEDSLK